MVLWKFGHFNLLAKYLEKYLSYGSSKILGILTCQQDISKSIWTRSLKYGQMKGDGA